MVVKHIQIYGAHISRKCIRKTEKKMNVDLFTTPRQNSPPGLYHHPLGRDKLSIPRANGVEYENLFENVLL